MTCHDVWSDLINHFIVYIPHFCDHFETDYLWTQSLLKFLNDAVKEQKQQKLTKNSQENNSFKIHEINAAVYHTLIKQLKKKSIQLFSLSVYKLNKKLKFFSQNAVNILKEMCFKNNFAENFASDQEINALLSDEYRDYYNVFDWKKTDEFPPHCQYDHWIKLTGEGIPPQSKIYPLSGYKLQKMKKYIAENLKKDFIEFSKALYSAQILFTLKVNEDLQFCVDYWRLNAITKHNCYSILLIDEVLAQVLDCKHMTCVNITTAFNKLWMHSDSEDLITFITSFNAFKYKVLPFGLTNRSASYQQYMNKVLFNFLNCFVQVYFDDILIYSKTCRKHINHIHSVLSRLQEAGLQANIQKCKFHVQKTKFLRLILTTEKLKVNLEKIEAIRNWSTLNNLKLT